MEGPTRPETGSSSKEVEVDYIHRIMRSLTDSSTSSQAAVPSEEESGIGLSSFNESYGRIPDVSPGLNPWSYFPPSPELRGLVDSAEPNWRSAVGSSPQILSPTHQEILADFPWLSNHLDDPARFINSSTATVSSSEVTFPRLTSSKDESDACTTSVEPSIESSPMTDQVAWAQSMLELQAFDNSIELDEVPAARNSSQAQAWFVDQAEFPEWSTLLTPANSETPLNSESLSSSLSDGEAELKKGSRKGGEDAAGTSAESTKRKRAVAAEGGEGDGEEDKSEDSDTKKPMNRPRKKGGVKRVREPRFAIKTRTDTEVMEDGYKWRKYGQKAVKNSSHPRNYYRCTTPNCPVRKRVERCSEDPGLVVTTYEGTHPHQSPSFLRLPLGYPGGLQALLANVSHQYMLAGHAPLPPLINTSASFPLSSSLDLHQPSPLLRSPLQSQGSIQENLNLLRAHEQLQRLQAQEAARASLIKSEPSFQFPAPTFSNMSDLSYDSKFSHYNSLNQPDLRILSPLEYGSLVSSGPFPSFGPRPEYVNSGALPSFRGAPCSQMSTIVSSDDGGLLEDMLTPTNPPISRV